MKTASSGMRSLNLGAGIKLEERDWSQYATITIPRSEHKAALLFICNLILISTP